jgi:hypothetical protein
LVTTAYCGAAMTTDPEVVAEFSRRVICGTSIDISEWATPDERALDENARSQYLSRKSAVKLYLLGASEQEIKSATSLSAKQAYRLIRERCLVPHSDGRPYGWRGLVPFLRIQNYKRRTKVLPNVFGGGAAGAFEALMNCHPEIKYALDRRILAIPSGDKLTENKKTARDHFCWWLDELRALGYEQRGEWPFNTTSLGYFSVRRYLLKTLESNPRSLAYYKGGPDLVTKLKSGDGTKRPVMRFMQRIEMDAHKLDGRFCVSIPNIDGTNREKIVHRLWVIVLLEVVSRAVFGYHFSLRKEVSAEDVLRAIKCALSKWKHREVAFAKVPYRPGAGLPSALGDKFVGLCWDEMSVDGALAETCGRVKNVLRDAVGSDLLSPETAFSRRRAKDDRPYIEAFFRNLAGKGFQRMTNTTGAKPDGRKGRDPDSVALASRFQFEYAEELLDVLIANYNAAPHSGIARRKPLEYAKFLYEHGQSTLRHVGAEAVQTFFSVRKLCKVRGGAETGRAPYVEFHYGRYTNEILQNRQDLVGSYIWVINHLEDDARVALASTEEGQQLGVLRAAPPWHLSPHSLSVRAAICQAASHGKFDIPPGADGIETFMNFVEAQPGNMLPVHPAYLESRRILVAAADQFIGESVLKSAKENASLHEQDLDRSISKKRNGQAIPASSDKTRGTTSASNHLPPRRLAATQK